MVFIQCYQMLLPLMKCHYFWPQDNNLKMLLCF